MIDIISKAEVYRKAAEVIVRDGKCEGSLIEGRDKHPTWKDALADRSLPVCAVGACLRAEYELYGTASLDSYLAYEHYEFDIQVVGGGRSESIVYYNDGLINSGGSVWRTTAPSAEDVALLLKKRAEEVDTGGE